MNEFMRLALKALSYPDVDIRKTYPVERGLLNLKAPLLKPLYRLWDRKIVCDGREITVRLYDPPASKKAGELSEAQKNPLLFFHGGGWVTESVDTYNYVCRNMARRTGRLVMSVEYRLAPENKFPAAVEDCYTAARELCLHGGPLGIRPGEVTLIGDSAGGNLAAAVSLMARDKGEFSVDRQILIYPATAEDHTETSPFRSVQENGAGYLLTSKRICAFMDLYASSPEDKKNPYFSPLLAEDFSRQPDTLIITAEFDPLRDEGEYYGQKLREAGNYVKIYRMLDALHGFFALDQHYIHVRRGYEVINRFLNNEDKDIES